MIKKIILTRDEARELDRRAIQEYGIPGIVLMENAGRSVAEYLMSLNPQGKIIICCGKGNNAGDGFVVARHLDNNDMPVHVLLFANPEELKGDAKINFDIIVKFSLPLTVISDENLGTASAILAEASWVVDAIFGTGLQGNVAPPYDKIIQMINNTKAMVLSIDIPSGLDCDTGKPLGIAVKATYTVTFTGYKKGFLELQAKEWLGQIYVADIGISKHIF